MEEGREGERGGMREQWRRGEKRYTATLILIKKKKNACAQVHTHAQVNSHRYRFESYRRRSPPLERTFLCCLLAADARLLSLCGGRGGLSRGGRVSRGGTKS